MTWHCLRTLSHYASVSAKPIQRERTPPELLSPYFLLQWASFVLGHRLTLLRISEPNHDATCRTSSLDLSWWDHDCQSWCGPEKHHSYWSYVSNQLRCIRTTQFLQHVDWHSGLSSLAVSHIEAGHPRTVVLERLGLRLWQLDVYFWPQHKLSSSNIKSLPHSQPSFLIWKIVKGAEVWDMVYFDFLITSIYLANSSCTSFHWSRLESSMHVRCWQDIMALVTARTSGGWWCDRTHPSQIEAPKSHIWKASV